MSATRVSFLFGSDHASDRSSGLIEVLPRDSIRVTIRTAKVVKIAKVAFQWLARAGKGGGHFQTRVRETIESLKTVVTEPLDSPLLDSTPHHTHTVQLSAPDLYGLIHENGRAAPWVCAILHIKTFDSLGKVLNTMVSEVGFVQHAFRLSHHSIRPNSVKLQTLDGQRVVPKNKRWTGTFSLAKTSPHVALEVAHLRMNYVITKIPKGEEEGAKHEDTVVKHTYSSVDGGGDSLETLCHWSWKSSPSLDLATPSVSYKYFAVMTSRHFDPRFSTRKFRIVIDGFHDEIHPFRFRALEVGSLSRLAQPVDTNVDDELYFNTRLTAPLPAPAAAPTAAPAVPPSTAALTAPLPPSTAAPLPAPAAPVPTAAPLPAPAAPVSTAAPLPAPLPPSTAALTAPLPPSTAAPLTAPAAPAPTTAPLPAPLPPSTAAAPAPLPPSPSAPAVSQSPITDLLAPAAPLPSLAALCPSQEPQSVTAPVGIVSGTLDRRLDETRARLDEAHRRVLEIAAKHSALVEASRRVEALRLSLQELDRLGGKVDVAGIDESSRVICAELKRFRDEQRSLRRDHIEPLLQDLGELEEERDAWQEFVRSRRQRVR
jgi:hypothetical protein